MYSWTSRSEAYRFHQHTWKLVIWKLSISFLLVYLEQRCLVGKARWNYQIRFLQIREEYQWPQSMEYYFKTFSWLTPMIPFAFSHFSAFVLPLYVFPKLNSVLSTADRNKRKGGWEEQLTAVACGRGRLARTALRELKERAGGREVTWNLFALSFPQWPTILLLSMILSSSFPQLMFPFLHSP